MRNKHLPVEARRQRTVEALVALAGMQNPSEIMTAALAKHMNVTQGAPFRHFPGKDAVCKMVPEWVAEELLDRVDRTGASGASPLDALRAASMSHVEFVVERPGVPRMMFDKLQRAEVTPAKSVAHDLMKRYAERLTRKLENAGKVEEVSTEADCRAGAILFIGMIQGLVMQSMLSGNIKSARTDAVKVSEVFRRGVAMHRKIEGKGSAGPRPASGRCKVCKNS